jgi:hypothetical protein
MSDLYCKADYLSIKKDYHNITNICQSGGVKFCDTTNPTKQFLYNFWGRIINFLTQYGDYSATRGQTMHPNATCNLWIWKKSDQIDRLTNHMDIFLINSTKIGVKFTKQWYNYYGQIMTHTPIINFAIPDVNTYDEKYIVNDINSPYNGIDPTPIIAEILKSEYQKVFSQWN